MGNNNNNFIFLVQGRRANINGLYIVNAQYKHTGAYECIAETVTLSISVKASVTVIGMYFITFDYV